MAYSRDKEIETAINLSISATPVLDCPYLIRFDVDNLKGKKLLDVGSGCCGFINYMNRFGARAYGIDVRYADIPSLDLWMADSYEKTLQTKLAKRVPYHKAINQMRDIKISSGSFFSDLHEHPEHYIAGLACELPFLDESFDIVFSINCITHGMDEDRDLALMSVQESSRVLKSGGELQIFPFKWSIDNKINRINSAMYKNLAVEGYSLFEEQVTGSQNRLRAIKP